MFRLSIYKGKQTISVRIKDTGKGIDPAFLPELLSPFKNETTGFSKGTQRVPD